MKKEVLTIVLIVICFIGSVIGLVSNITSKKTQTSIKQENSEFIEFMDKRDKIALISLNGVIQDQTRQSSFFPKQSPSSKARKYLNKALNDKSVKGVLLRINSPGGTLGASQEVYDVVMRCRKQKPVVVSMADVAASGGYYIASASDVIVANPGTITGSIGVIINAMNFTELMDKVGVKNNTIKSGNLKDILSPFRPMKKNEEELLQSIIMESYEQFISAIIEGRITYPKEHGLEPKLSEDVLRKYADGRIITGQQGKKLGFIDELGDITVAKTIVIDQVKKKFKNIDSDIKIVSYDKPNSLSEYLMELSFDSLPNADIREQLPFSFSHPNQPLWIME